MKLVYTYYIIQTNIIQGASYMKNYKKPNWPVILDL